jgi:photosystem II stability/assembly factor-like uncharacterized protein
MTKLCLSLIVFLLSFNPIYSQWTQTNGPGTSPVNALYNYQGILFAGTQSDGVYKSIDNGDTWIPARTGLENTSVNTFGSNSDYLFVSVISTSSSLQGVYRSSDLGESWTQINTGRDNTYISALLAVNSNIYAGTVGTGVWKSTNNGDSWFPSNSGMAFELISSIAISNNNIYAAASNFLYVSADQGGSWSPVPDLSYFTIRSLNADNNFIYVGVFGGLKMSSDYGQTWSPLIDILFIPPLSYIQSFCSDGSILYGGINAYPGTGFGVIKSTDQGLTWAPANAGIEERSITSVLFSSSKLFAGSLSGGIFLSTDQGSSWIKDNSGLPPGGLIRSFLSYSNYIFAGTQLDGIYGSSDGGATWESFDNDVSGELKFALVFTLAQKDNAIYAGTSTTGIYKSTDGGADWFNVNNGLPVTNLITFSIITGGNNLIVGTSNGIYYSTDDGGNWIVSNVTEGNVQYLAAGSGYQYAVVTTGISSNDGVYRSSDNGVSWNLIYSTSSQYPSSLAATGSNVYLGDSFSGIVHSTDNGNGFSTPSLQGTGVFSIYPNGQNIFVGTSQESDNIYMSDLDATDWQPINEGLPPGTPINAIVADNFYLYVGTENNAVWNRVIGQIIPVELTAFTAIPEGNDVILNWQTASETNNKGFDVERQVSSQWEKVGFVEGNGTSTAPHSYSYRDRNLNEGRYNYRLKQIDLDGSYKYSGTIEVQAGSTPDQYFLSRNYPNPFNPSTTIEFTVPENAGNVRLTIYNVLGEKAAEIVNGPLAAGKYTYKWNAKNITSGIYFYELKTDKYVSIKKMILLK